MKKFIFRIADLYAPFRGRLLKSFLLLICIEFIGLLNPYIYGRLINAASVRDFDLIVLFSVGYLAIRLTFRAFDWVRDEMSMRLIMDTDLHIQNKTMGKVLEYSVGQHHNENSGIKQQVINRGQNAIEQATDQVLWTLAPMSFNIIAAMAILIFYNFSIGLIVALGISLYLTVTLRAHSKFVPQIREVRKKDQETGKLYGEVVRNVEVVKLNAQEEKTKGEYLKALSETNQISCETWIGVIRQWFLSGVWVLFTNFAVYLAAGSMVYSETITIGAMVACIGWAESALGRIQNAGGVQRRLMDWHVDIERYFEMIDVESDIKVLDNPVRPEKYVGEITFENVSFAYPRRKYIHDDEEGEGEAGKEEKNPVRDAVSNISFTLEAGKRYAIVGESGSEKSTIRHLLLRSYDPQEGRVLIDGIDLRTLDLSHYLARIGVVDQDVMLFDRTLRENIVWARRGSDPALSDKELLSICHQACIDKFFVRLERGLDTIIGERGVKLSGGEKQRVAIARALAKEPSMLVCDEATSHLDSVNETDITESIEKASAGRTTIVIAHRLSTILSADKILVMDNGKLVGMGTHRELYGSCANYRALVGNQIRALEKLHLAQVA